MKSANVFTFSLDSRQYTHVANSSGSGIFSLKLKGNELAWYTGSKIFTQSLTSAEPTLLYDGSYNDPYYANPKSVSVNGDKVAYAVEEAKDFRSVSSVYMYDSVKKEKTLIEQSTESMHVDVTANQVFYVGGDHPSGTRDIYALTFTPPVPTDTVAPLANITSPSDGSTIYGELIVKGSVSDNYKLQDYTVTLRNSNDEIIKVLTHVPDNSINVISEQELLRIDTTTIADGNYSISLEARDAAGNSGPESHDRINVVINNIPDNIEQCKNESYKLFPAKYKNSGACIASIQMR